jgi:hypothetical protein
VEEDQMEVEVAYLIFWTALSITIILRILLYYCLQEISLHDAFGSARLTSNFGGGGASTFDVVGTTGGGGGTRYI